ncbi:MAG: 2,3-bisphosphoglycerate-independent phosphoglycerate mutase [Eubacteriales bacterium]|nr:2,3-bisphosphoglycerate-independent phosphoglycerate mutase [Eubacteriales bacterium]
MNKKTIVLMILDGWGKGRDYIGNAIARANTPNFNALMSRYPNTLVKTSGYDVGLPDGQMGNSEVGHLNIGAGRVVYQEYTRITKSMESGEAKDNPILNRAFNNALKNNSKLHLMGLVSDGGVHSHNTHLYYLIRYAKEKGIKDIFVHCFLDGRDVPPTSGAGYIKALQNEMAIIGAGKIATVMGRYYAMDRDNRWERTKLAYDALTKAEANYHGKPIDGIENSYLEGINDEFIKPIISDREGMIEEGDSIIFFNFRPDRARQLTRALTDDHFIGFERHKIPTEFVCLTQYDITLKNVSVAYAPQSLDNTLGEYISRLGFKQLRLAETEKYAHVTFFFNGGVEKSVEGEDRILIPSPKVATYDLKPEMSAYIVKDTLLEQLKRDYYDVIIVNFANADMVGHTGVIPAAIKAIEAVDICLGEVAAYVIDNGLAMMVTADHGNAEEMINEEDNSVLTQHTTNAVPFILVSPDKHIALRSGCKLADIAPTILDLMTVGKPDEMTGETMIKR